MKLKTYKDFKKNKCNPGETDSFKAPEYLAQPHEGETGFFMFKKAFDNMKKRFETGYFSTTINNS